MNTRLISRLEELSKVAAPSCFEHSFQAKYKKDLLSFCKDVNIDSIGNAIATKRNKNNHSIMMVAHADEVGFIIVNISEKGFLYLKCIGHIEPSIVECQHIDIYHDGTVIEGVVGRCYCHEKKIDKISELWVDIGVRSKEEAMKFVSIGDYAVFHSKVITLENGLISGKSLDDRAGLVVIEEVFRQIDSTDYDIFLVASAQEEIGCRGGAVAANRLNPTICIVVDVTFATDYPTSNSNEQGDICLGGGVVIPFGANVNNKLQNLIKNIAIDAGISYQVEALPTSSGTDAKTIQIVGEGINTCLLSIPCRYMHSPVEIVSVFDMEQAVKLILSFIKTVEIAQIHLK